MRRWLIAAAAVLVVPVAALAQPVPASEDEPLTVEVLRTSDGSLNVNVALIMGERDAVMVDAPFTLADAHRAVAMVLDSGRNLTHVFITHDHPDHFFAMEVIRDAFPDVQIVAHPVVVADVWRSLPFKVARWSPMLGANGPVHPSAPAALEGDTIMLEGHALQVLGPMQGDHPHATALWAPDIAALFPGDIVFYGMHLWLGEHDPENVTAWRETLDELAALEPRLVVPGHSAPGLEDDPAAIAFSQRYLSRWQDLSQQAENSQQLRDMVRAEFPDTIDALGDFILTTSSRVATGEEPKWQE
ncbi:MAG: MBL fold metallo-hydrolase [Erythrobacter sp.]|nr:MBL fold metallo-hydrolase [Erythrobacter sp.]